MLITLTTDFGTSDHFVGAMKGVILGIATRARIVDITHQITPFEMNEAAFTIAEAARWFPKGAIHVVVVDPGVGTARRPILVEAAGQRFIGPDNGVFTMIYDQGPHKVREITNNKMMLKTVSRTFHGRDVFAPAAAHLASGVAPARFGKLISDFVRSEMVKPALLKKHRWLGRVLKVDHFGNLITNFHMREFGELRMRAFEILAGTQIIRRLALTYAESGIGELVAIEGSSGFLELSANQESAAEKLGCGVGAPVELEIF
jgi:S-adenosyl-L-methionine hydrolase (adenosine-forming)